MGGWVDGWMEGWRDRLTGGWINRWAAIHLERAALHGRRRAPRAVGVHSPFAEAVVPGIGVDDHADGAPCLGVGHLVAPEDAAVAGHHDGSVGRQALRSQRLVVILVQGKQLLRADSS